MPHRLEHLRTTLHQLEVELAQRDDLDEEAREKLRQTIQEIESALEEAQSPEAMRTESFQERLSENVRSFEADHPTLSAVVHRVIDALAQMGI